MRIKVRLTVKHLLPVLVIAALSIWMAKRWNVWFGNVPEQPYSAPDRPSRIMLTFGDEQEGSRNISWQCDSILHPSMVQTICLADSDTVYTEAAGEIFASRRGRSAYYVARLRHLKAGREYAYRVVTGTMASPWYHFRTYEPGRSKFSFLYVGDVQDTLYGKANMFLRQALKRHPQSEFIVCGGDLTERPTAQHWAETYRNTDSVAQAMPLLCVTGNHDYLKGLVRRLERRFPLIFSYFLDSAIDNNQVYTLTYGNVQFFLLDSNRELPYLLKQRKWLERQLCQSEAKWKIVILHHPLYSIKGNNNLIQRWVFDGVIRKYGVDLILQGHEHAYARMTMHDERGRAATPVYTVSHCSPKNYRIEFNNRFDKFGISSRYYQTIEIREDTMILAAYEVYGHTLYDSLHIVKPVQGETYIEDLGKDIPEYLEYTPNPHKKKDLKFARRIEAYKKRHVIRSNHDTQENQK